MNSNKTQDLPEQIVRRIARIVASRPLAAAIYESVDKALKSKSAHIAGGDTVWKVFKHSLDAAIRDINEHPRGKLFRRLLEHGVHHPEDPEVLTSDEETLLSDPECGSCVQFIHSHMINRFKGELAELLAVEPCLSLIRELKQQGQVSPVTQLYWGDLIREPCQVGLGSDLNPVWGRFRKGADGLLIERAHNALKLQGVVEVKSMARTKKRVTAQIDKHIARLHGGVELGGLRFPPGSIELADVVRIAVAPSSWRVTRERRKVKTKHGWNLVFPKATEPPTRTHAEELESKVWKITLSWSQEALHQAAYQMTFWYMAQVGKNIYKKKESLPSAWGYMTPAEAGQNATKERLFFIPLRRIDERQQRLAITLYNVYGYGYPLGMDAHKILTKKKGEGWRNEILWPEDVFGEDGDVL
jgi:hypothetical protein